MNETWDVVVIGGGPSGMMSAGTAAARGLRVLLIEKNPTLGKKLRITGGGRCNITNSTPDERTLLSRYGEADKFLFSTFSQYGVRETITFFNQQGLITKVEAENRVFPASEKAEDVALVMEKFIMDEGVSVLTNVAVKRICTEDSRVTHLETTEGDIFAKSFILATGGTSRPDTGSTGDGYSWLSNIGHKVTVPTPSLVPITIKEKWVQDISGLSLPDTNINLYQDDVLVKKASGKILFTHNGLSGPGILNLSTTIGNLLIDGEVTLKINIATEKSEEVLSEQLKDTCITHANKKIKNVLSDMIPTSLVSIVLMQNNIDGERQCNTVTRTERHQIVSTMRGLKVTVWHLLGPEKAVVASGGVALNEIDFKNMSSNLFPNLYIVGDMLDIVRPSGGYSLQLCWTTGYVAGNSVAS